MVWLWHLLFVLALLIQLAFAKRSCYSLFSFPIPYDFPTSSSKSRCEHGCKGYSAHCSTNDDDKWCCDELTTGELAGAIVFIVLVLVGIAGGIVACCFCCAGCPIYKSRARKKNAAPVTQVTATPASPLATATAPSPQATAPAPPPQANAKGPYPEEPTPKSGTQETTTKSRTEKTSTA